MNNSNLGILERLFIILRCHKDIRRHRFVEFEYSGDKVADVEKQINYCFYGFYGWLVLQYIWKK